VHEAPCAAQQPRTALLPEARARPPISFHPCISFPHAKGLAYRGERAVGSELDTALAVGRQGVAEGTPVQLHEREEFRHHRDREESLFFSFYQRGKL